MKDSFQPLATRTLGMGKAGMIANEAQLLSEKT
jgi:hypothetical protein